MVEETTSFHSHIKSHLPLAKSTQDSVYYGTESRKDFAKKSSDSFKLEFRSINWADVQRKADTSWIKSDSFQRKVDEDTLPTYEFIDKFIVHSIGRYYGFLTEDDTGQHFSISDEALSILATFLEFRLRLIIQEASKYTRLSVSSRSRGGRVTFYNVLAALEMLHINFDSTSIRGDKFLPHLAISESRLSFRSVIKPINDIIPTFPLDILFAVYDAQEAIGLDPLLNTGEVASHQSESVPSSAILPQASVFWVALDGNIVTDKHNTYNVLKCKPEEEVPPYSLEIRYPSSLDRILLDKNKCVFRNLGHHLCSLGVVSQAKKVSHVLSREHLLLLNYLRDVLREPFTDAAAENHHKVVNAIETLKTSPGLSQLVPYLSYFLVVQIHTSLSLPSPYMRPNAGIRVMIRAILALAHNAALQTHFWLHQLLHSVMYVVLHPVLGLASIPFSEAMFLKHFAAKAVSILVKHNACMDGGRLCSLVSSIYQQVLADVEQPITTMLGAVMGLRCLKFQMSQEHVVSRVVRLLDLLEKNLFSSPEQQEVTEIREAIARKSQCAELEKIMKEAKVALLIELLGWTADHVHASMNIHSIPKDLLHYNTIIQKLGDMLGKYSGKDFERKQNNFEYSKIPDYSTSFM